MFPSGSQSCFLQGKRSSTEFVNFVNNNVHQSWETLTCNQAFFFRRRAKEKQRETRRSVGQSGFSLARKKTRRLSRYYTFALIPKRTPDRRLGKRRCAPMVDVTDVTERLGSPDICFSKVDTILAPFPLTLF